MGIGKGEYIDFWSPGEWPCWDENALFDLAAASHEHCSNPLFPSGDFWIHLQAVF